MYYQCVEDKEKGGKDKEEMKERVQAVDKNITVKDKEAGWEKINSTKKEEIGAKCLGWPVKGAKKVLKPYQMCGGTGETLPLANGGDSWHKDLHRAVLHSAYWQDVAVCCIQT